MSWLYRTVGRARQTGWGNRQGRLGGFVLSVLGAAIALVIVGGPDPTASQQPSPRGAPVPPVFRPAPQELPSLYPSRQPATQPARVAAPLIILGGKWIPQGPRPIVNGQVENASPNDAVSGAIKAVVADPANPNIVYVGAVNGGVWKTTNGTASSPRWTPLTDQQSSLSIGALKFDPTDKTSNTLIAGIGRFSSDEQLGGPRTGVLRTTDRGATWTALDGGGTLSGANIAGIAARGSTLVAAVDVADKNSLTNEGIFRSVDTGAHFEQISGNGTSGLPLGVAYDLAEDPSDPATLYTGIVFAGLVSAPDGIYKSTDTGATWALVSNAAINGLFHDKGANSTRNVKISVGNADNVYVGIENGTSKGWQLAGLFRSGDGGAHWTALDLPVTNEHGTLFGINPGGQGTLHFSILADPDDPNIVYVGGDRQPAANEGAARAIFPNSLGATTYSGRLFRIDASKPAGSQFAHLTNSNKLGPAGGGTANNSSPHADSRGMVFDSSGNLLEVDDGGVFRRTSPKSNTGSWSALSGNLQVTEFHDIAYDGNSRIIFGGTQDVGMSQQQKTGGGAWNDIELANGGCVATRPSAMSGISLRYTSSQDMYRFTVQTYDAANVVQSTVFQTLFVISGAAFKPQFFTPIVANEVDPNRLLVGGSNSLYESMDQGNTISEVGKGIVANDAIQRKALVYGGRSGGIDNPDLIYAGQKDRIFVRTVPAPAPFTELARYPGLGSGREVNGIAINPDDYNTVFAVDTSQVYQSTDTGTTWTNITGNLTSVGSFATAPNLDSINFIRHSGTGGLVVGSGHGVFISLVRSLSLWYQLGTGLPNAHVERLSYDPVSNILVAGTLGRGSWSINLNPAWK